MLIETLPAAVRNRLARLAKHLNRDERGVSMVEFALILPVMITMYLGIVEVGDAVQANRRMTNAASAIGDLAAQADGLDDCGITIVFDAAKAVMHPYNATDIKMAISFIKIDRNKNATLLWSEGKNRVPRTAVPTIPSNLNYEDTFLMYSEVEFSYNSPTKYIVRSSLTMKEDYFLRPRMGLEIPRLAGCASS